MDQRKPSFSFASGERPDPRTVTTPLAYVRYARQRLGCEVPVMGTARGAFYERLAEEMDIQGWTIQDLVCAVDYLHDKKIVIRKIEGVFFFVDEAKGGSKEIASHEISRLVAEALEVEQDEGWRRRLGLAAGKALGRVYEEWLKERGFEV